VRSKDVRRHRRVNYPGVCTVFPAVDEPLEGPSIAVGHLETGSDAVMTGRRQGLRRVDALTTDALSISRTAM